jgi:tellurite resistance protein TerC
MANEYLFFGSFLLFIVLMLSIDLGLFNKKARKVSMKEAAVMSFIWVSFALGFYFLLITNGEILHGISNFVQLQEFTAKNLHNITLNPTNYAESLTLYKQNLGLEFITGYVIEYALSVDNIFVMVLIFTAFNVDEKYYHRVLFWGIIGAVFMRFIFIFLGSTLINEFGWIMYIFGAFLLYTGIGMFISKDEEEEIDTENHQVVRFASKHFAVYPEYVGNKFFIKVDGAKMVTPLFIVLLIIEFTDLIFAVDSIPAIFAFFSNIFAILGLRSMFFLLANVIHKFHFLKAGLAFLLVFIGVKMLAHHWLSLWGFSTMHSLFVILLILTTSIVASLVFPKKGS